MERKRKDLSLKERMDILERFDKLPKMSQRNAAAQLGISQPLLCKILKNREDLVRKSRESEFLGIKRNRQGKAANVEKALKVWFTHVRKLGVSVDGPLLQHKAQELASQMGKEDFVATSGWFQRWKKRENIVYDRVYEETEDADGRVPDPWITEEWPKLCNDYAPENVYNANETGLYFRAMPEHTHLFQSDDSTEQQILKEHITVLCCVNMIGEKKRLLVVGKNKNPRCFKNVKELPVDYFSNKSAWMTATIFNEWLLKWDNALTKNVLLLIDSCTAHTVNVVLQHINLVYLPADNMSLIQPLDQGIVHACKVHYRNEMRARILEQLDSAADIRVANPAEKFTLLEALHLLNKAWGKVTGDIIRQGFSRGGFFINDSQGDYGVCVGIDEQPTDLSLEDYEAWMSIDYGIQVAADLTELDIRKVYCPGAEDVSDDQMDDATSSPEDQLEILPPTNDEMRNALHVLRRGVMQNADTFIELYRFEDFVNEVLRENIETNHPQRGFHGTNTS